MRFGLGKFFVLVILGVVLPGGNLWAKTKDSFAEYAPTFFIDTTFGLTTYKSKMVESNDTGTGLTYSIGGHGGENREYGFLVKTDTSATSFLLNESKIQVSYQDSILRYRIWAFYLGAVFSQIDLKVNNQGTEQFDAGASGMGGNFGFYVPISRIGVFYTDVTSVTYSKFRNVLDEEVKGGSRMDIDLGAYFDVTREFLDFMVGYKQRTASISADSSSAEAYYKTYLGFRAAVFF